MFRCKTCGARSPGWSGRCTRCDTWGSLERAAAPDGDRPARGRGRPTPSPRTLPEIGTQPVPRRASGIAELDRVLGGGFVPGSVVLIGGEPGIGKSTLLLATAAQNGGDALYVTGEEAPRQVALRAARLGLADRALRLLDATDVDDIVDVIVADRPALCVIDSVQTLRARDVNGVPGGPAQVRAAAERLVPAARATDCALVLVGQVTKIGGLAGPRFLEHAVDTVVFFEGDRHLAVRALRVVKNRYGATDEIGLFEMHDDGLREVRNASDLLLATRGVDGDDPGPGSAIATVVEGRRAMCVEVQALLVGQDRKPPRRRAQGADARRAELVVGVVESLYCGAVADRDVYVNLVGGLTIQDTGLDLAVAAAVLSAQLGVPLDNGAVVCGEIGLRGEVRPVPRLAARLKEARAMGFQRAYVPRGTPPLEGMTLVEVGRVDQVLPEGDAMKEP